MSDTHPRTATINLLAEHEILSFALSLSERFGAFAAVTIETEAKQVGYSSIDLPFQDRDIRPASLLSNRSAIYIYDRQGVVRWLSAKQVCFERKIITLYQSYTSEQSKTYHKILPATGY